MGNDPRLSILIPAYNEEDFLPATLASVRQSCLAIGLTDYELIVCDNNSTDATARLAAEAGAQVVFESHNQIARARNTAAKAARGQWLVFLDADTQLNAATLGNLLIVLESGNIGAGGSVLALDAQQLGLAARVVVQTWNSFSRLTKLAAGSFIFCRRDAWVQTGGFDETLYASEEIWFSRALRGWCRANNLRFTILTGAPIITSARKLRWYTPGQLCRQFAMFLIPGAWRRRDRCATWYTRPIAAEKRPPAG